MQCQAEQPGVIDRRQNGAEKKMARRRRADARPRCTARTGCVVPRDHRRVAAADRAPRRARVEPRRRGEQAEAVAAEEVGVELGPEPVRGPRCHHASRHSRAAITSTPRSVLVWMESPYRGRELAAQRSSTALVDPHRVSAAPCPASISGSISGSAISGSGGCGVSTRRSSTATVGESTWRRSWRPGGVAWCRGTWARVTI